jgi:hypothetical protein
MRELASSATASDGLQAGFNTGFTHKTNVLQVPAVKIKRTVSNSSFLTNESDDDSGRGSDMNLKIAGAEEFEGLEWLDQGAINLHPVTSNEYKLR